MKEALFFAGRPMEAALYEKLMELLRCRLAPFEVKVQKTQITLVNPRVFACVSLRWKNCLTVSFGLPDKVCSPRIHQAVEPYPNRWTHHVKVRGAEEMDEELLGWLGAAYAFAKMK